MAQQAAALWGDVEGSADGTTGDASKRGAVGVGVSEVVRERCWPNSSDRRGAGRGKSAVGTADVVQHAKSRNVFTPQIRTPVTFDHRH